MAEVDAVIAEVRGMVAELDRRIAEHGRLEAYVGDEGAVPNVITEARLTRLYEYLLPKAEAPWATLIVDSKLDRLEPTGIRDGENREAAELIWAEGWQANSMDAESKLGHAAALTHGRFYATVWPTADGTPDIALDDQTQMIVKFAEGSRRKRVAALRKWKAGDTLYATLYRTDGVFKFEADATAGATAQTTDWKQREVAGEDWPLPLPDVLAGEIPVVEIAVNRRLKPGVYPYARGEFAHCTGLIDRINLLTFLGLVVAIWQGFPIRGVIGERIRREILKDDDGNTILDETTGEPQTRTVPPFEAKPDSIAQIENPEAKTFEFAGADRKNLSVFAELDQLAVITKTPRHYFPLEGGMSNLSAEAIMASEGGMHAAVTGHEATLGEGWEDVCRLAGRILGTELTPQASLQWADHSSRSLAERADAFTKLASSLPWVAAAEIALNVTDEQIARWQTEQAMSPIMSLIRDAQNGDAGTSSSSATDDAGELEPASSSANGNGAGD